MVIRISWKEINKRRERGEKVARKLTSSPRTRARNPEEQRLLDQATAERIRRGENYKFD